MKKLIWLYVLILVLGFYNVAGSVEIGVMWNWEDPVRNSECLAYQDPFPCCEDVAIGTCHGYRLGDVTSIKEDGAYWGGIDPRANPNSRIIIVSIPGLSQASFVQYMQPLFDEADPDRPVLLFKRRFKFDKNKVPQNIKNYVENQNGFVEISLEDWNNWRTDNIGRVDD